MSMDESNREASSLQEAIQELHRSRTWADVIIAVSAEPVSGEEESDGVVEIPSHSLVLRMRSAFMRQLLDELQNDDTSSILPMRIPLPLPSCEIDVLQHVIRFMYLDEVDFRVCSGTCDRFLAAFLPLTPC